MKWYVILGNEFREYIFNGENVINEENADECK